MASTYTVFTSNAGHSAKSPGASGNGFKEHEQARLCNKAFIEAMKVRRYDVIDTTSDARNKAAVLQEQVAKANKVGGSSKQLNASFHLNAGGGTGVEVLHYGDSTKVVAARVSAAIAKALGIKDRGAKQRQDLYFLRKTKSPAILVEACFIDNAEDMAKFTKKYRAAMDAVAAVLAGASGTSDSSTEPSTSSTVSTATMPKNPYKGNSVVDYLKAVDIDSSFKNRAKLAVTYGIVKNAVDYDGTMAQNTALLAALRKAEK